MRTSGEIKLKVCGMRAPENILEVAKLSPDYMGFIFFGGSKRFIGDNMIIPENFPAAIKKVGVFVNEQTSGIVNIASRYNLDFAQLHGEESVDQCAELRKEGVKVIKAFSIDGGFNFNETDQFKNVVDFFLFDAKGVNHGGNGIPFNWSLLKNYDQEIPFFLSGGISIDNVENINQLTEMNIHAIDINSQVESSIGIKNPVLIAGIRRKMITSGITQ